MAQQPPETQTSHGGFRNLGLRLRSAALFAPPVIAAVYFGTPWFDILVAGAAIVMAWEWARMCTNQEFTVTGWAMEAGIAVCLLTLYLSNPVNALIVVAGCVALVAVIAVIRRHESPVRMAIGAAIFGSFCLSFLWLRALPENGLEIVIWLLLAVWFTDAGGYFFGRTIGGPKLAPRISPNKTWSGLGGGIFLATVWSVIWLFWQGGYDLSWIVPAAVSAAILAQIGDLSVSSVKRRFGVKDSSGLIPGHGGVLDRLDGMLLTGPVAAFVLFLSGKGWI